MTSIGVLHPGEMGAAVAACLAEAGHEVAWASAGRSEDTRRRASGMLDLGTPDELAARCDVMFSICPPGAAADVARVATGHGAFVDANAIAPETAASIAAAVGPGYVDGGIIGPPPPRAGTTRLYLSGDGAERVAGLFEGTRLEPRVLGDAGPTAASALKMAYAAWTKGSAALLLAIEAAASELGVSGPLRDEWALSQLQLADRLSSAQGSAEAKGWRWTDEMLEIARTFGAANQPEGFHQAAAEIYGRYQRRG